MSANRARKEKFRQKLQSLLDSYEKILVISVDNVGSNQLQQTRILLRGKAEILMGKNTVIRAMLRENISKNPALEQLLPHVRGNIGFVFVKDDIVEVRSICEENQSAAPAKAGTFAPSDVIIPVGPTGLDPGQTTFFQALNISTKITRGAIEIMNPVHLITAGDRVSASAVALLNKLNLKPFFYGIKATVIYDEGSVYAAAILDLSEDDKLAKFFKGVTYVAAVGLAIGHPSLATVPHSIRNGFKKLIAISLETGFEFEEAKPFHEYLANPEAFAAAAAPAAGAAAAAPVEEEEEEEESEEDMGFSLFD